MFFANSEAQTIVPGGFVSGIWTPLGSPYLIQGNLTIPLDSSLIIEPSVQVTFQGNYSLLVNGLLKAEGAPGDSIRFGVSGGSWKGLRFVNSVASNRLAYCTVQGVLFHGAIKSDASNLVVTHCRISDNQSSGGSVAGGILVVNSSPEISYCNISGNVAYGNGGGITCSGNSAVLISYCTLNGNVAQGSGGGIYVSNNSSAVITHCTMSGNYAGEFGGGLAYDGANCSISFCNFLSNDANFGGGLWTSSSQVTLTQSSFWDNAAQGEGGGIWISSADAQITRCAFNFNAAFGYVGYPVEHGGAIYALDCAELIVDHSLLLYNHCNGDNFAGGIQLEGNTSITLTNSILKGGHSWGIGALISFEGLSADVSYNDFFVWPGEIAFLGNLPPGLGQYNQINANGDPCDVYQNIAGDPMFVNAYSDFHLQEGSPCIDAGDPVSPFDPDSTIADVGRYFFDQRAPDIEVPTSILDFGSVNIGEMAQLPLMIYNVGSDTLQIYDITCGNPVFSTTWTPSQGQILPGGNLQIMVSFAPVGFQSYEDSLYIENNSEPCAVLLVGSCSGMSDVDERSNGDLPGDFALRGPYPNPFNPTTTFCFDLPTGGYVRLAVYDIAERLVQILVSGYRAAGTYQVNFEGSGLAAGLYLYRFEAGDLRSSGKLVLMK
ncbi:MAG TPA: right-handed parallel beta-helix repeat-containing protein [bacterium]